MLNKIKQYITVAAFGLMVAVPVAVPAVVSAADADIQGSVCQGATLTVPEGGVPEGCVAATEGAGTGVNDLIRDVINIFSFIVGVVAVIMIIIGGFQYITSAGDSNKVGTAKNTILYAIIGLVIVALSQFIVRFVLSRVTSA